MTGKLESDALKRLIEIQKHQGLVKSVRDAIENADWEAIELLRVPLPAPGEWGSLSDTIDYQFEAAPWRGCGAVDFVIVKHSPKYMKKVVGK